MHVFLHLREMPKGVLVVYVEHIIVPTLLDMHVALHIVYWFFFQVTIINNNEEVGLWTRL